MFPPDAQFAVADLDFDEILFPYIANGITTVQVDVGPAGTYPTA